MTTRKDFVSTMIRQFKDRSFKKGTLYFRYDGTLYPVVRINSGGIYYGRQPYRIENHDFDYRIDGVHLRRSLLSIEVVIDISYLRRQT